MSEAAISQPYWQPEFERLLEEMKTYTGGGVVYMVVTIPRVPAPDEAEAADDGSWPVRLQLAELPVEHRVMIDFLIERIVPQ